MPEPRIATASPGLDPAWSDGPTVRLAAVPPGADAAADEIADELRGMAATLGEVDPRAAERLDDLARAVTTPDGRARWADVDLGRAFQTDHLAYAYATRKVGGHVSPAVVTADRVRNVLVLAPVLLTWFALAEASRAYAEYIAQNPEAVSQPFLLLWENRFGGFASPLAPTFSFVALVDAVLLALIIALTVYAHGRRDDRDDQIARVALAFQGDLDNALAEATVVLARDRAGRPAALATGIERLADRFERSSQELLTRLRVEHDRLEQLAARREREFADFGVFASGMRAGAEETHKLLVELRAVSSGLQTALEDLTDEVSLSADQGRSLLAAVQGLERLTVGNVESDRALTRRIGEAAEAIADAADRALAGADSAAQAGRVATETGKGIADVAQALARGQARLETALADEAETVGRLADALRGSVGGVQASTRTLQEIEASLGAVRAGFDGIAAQGAEQARTLRALLAEQEAIAGGLAEVARDIGSIAVASANRQDAAGRDVAALVARLDTLADAISRANGLPTPSAALPRPADEEPRRDPARLWPQRRGQS